MQAPQLERRPGAATLPRPAGGQHMDAARFGFLRDFLRRESGLIIEEHKLYLLQSRLQPLLDQHGLASLDALSDALRRGNPALAREVVDAMTTNETLFFRDQYPFDALRERILPECRRRGREVRIWSAAASTGQETWSIAITAQETLPDARSTVRIIGTDISHRALERAREGRYTEMETRRGLPPSLRQRYFEQDDRMWRVGPDLRAMARFLHGNLISPRLPAEMRTHGPFDVVFCRNVLIYFSPEARRKVVDNLAHCMREEAWLVTGATEIPHGVRSRWKAEAFAGRNLWRLEQKP